MNLRPPESPDKSAFNPYLSCGQRQHADCATGTRPGASGRLLSLSPRKTRLPTWTHPSIFMPRFLPLIRLLLCCSGSVAVQDDFRSELLRQFEYSARRLNALTVLLQRFAHMDEHVGQAIAYARINGVVPPWSR